MKFSSVNKNEGNSNRADWKAVIVCIPLLQGNFVYMNGYEKVEKPVCSNQTTFTLQSLLKLITQLKLLKILSLQILFELNVKMATK